MLQQCIDLKTKANVSSPTTGQSNHELMFQDRMLLFFCFFSTFSFAVAQSLILSSPTVLTDIIEPLQPAKKPKFQPLVTKVCIPASCWSNNHKHRTPAKETLDSPTNIKILADKLTTSKT